MLYMAQHAWRMLLSNGALCAAMNSALSIQVRRVDQSSPKVGASCTSFQRRPWIPVNANCGDGGRIRNDCTTSILLPRPAAKPTAHALSLR